MARWCAEIGDYTGFPEMLDGRAKTLHPESARRHPRAGAICRRMRPRRGSTASRPIDLSRGQPVSMPPRDRRESPAAQSMLPSRTDRHRRARHGARRGEELAARRDRRRSGGLRSAARRASSENDAYAVAKLRAAHSSWQGVLAHRRLRRRDLELAHERRLLAAPRAHFLRASTFRSRSSRSCATARTRIRSRPSIATRGPAPGWHRRHYRQLQGKALSFNGFIADSDAAWECVKTFSGLGESAACVIVKHANPCGVALGDLTARCRLSQSVRDRSRIGIRRHHRLQSAGRRAQPLEAVAAQFVEVR